MSVGPSPAAPEEPPSAVPPRLRLVAGHEHEWQLRSVEYDDGLVVRRYECTDCDDVLFR